MYPFWRLLIIFLTLRLIESKRNISHMHLIISQLLEGQYNGEIRPGAVKSEPTYVYLNFRINSMSALRETSMDYTVNVYLRMMWFEPRLAFQTANGEYTENDAYTLSHKQFSKLWIPDLFIKNEKDGKLHDLVLPNKLMRLNASGSILYSQRLSLTLACELDLTRFPLDNQTCKFIFASYAHTLEDVIILWTKENPVQAIKDLKVPEFELLDITTGYCISNSSTGAYACLEAILFFQRQVNYYLIQVYLPSLLVVVLSWVSFWIDADAVPARVTLGLLTVLTMTTQSSNFAARMPRVSYVKAIDVWMASCLLFVFGALVEYSFVNVLVRRSRPMRQQMINNLVKQAQANGPSDTNDSLDKHRHEALETQVKLRRANSPEVLVVPPSMNMSSIKNRGALIDKFSRFTFPLVFGLFNLFYWIYYLTNTSSSELR